MQTNKQNRGGDQFRSLKTIAVRNDTEEKPQHTLSSGSDGHMTDHFFSGGFV